ncbi:MAG: hypothetical protein K6F86_02655 [Lachnospiraceae bacterium]|nr:hypothetical protein [Lachnospiraceae bacterium]
MDERPDLYEQIVDEYMATGSVRQVVKNLNTNTIKVRRVLITEGLWESESSRNVGALYYEGKTTKEIAQELCMSEKNVQSYLPYSRGAYGGKRSNDAERSEEYRKRMKSAAEGQAFITETKDKEEPQTIIAPGEGNIIRFPELDKPHRESSEAKDKMPEQLPGVLKLKLELVAPYYTHRGRLDMEPEEESEFLRFAKAEKGIIREVLVHGETKLHALHYIIQKLFGWQNGHLHHYSLSDKDFDMATNRQNLEEYLKLCGTLFLFPGSELDDRFWDDDYVEGISFKSWLRSKYVFGYRDYSVENSYMRNLENIRRFRKRFKKEIANPRITLQKISEKVAFENSFNEVLEGISVRNLFKSALPGEYVMTDAMWRGFQDVMIQGVKLEFEELEEQDPKEYKAVLGYMQDLMDLRKNILNIEKMVRYGQGKQVRDFYKADPAEVVSKQREIVRGLEWSLEPYLSSGNAKVLPFIDELYYIYDYGDDWCVRITCEDAYTANANYDPSFMDSLEPVNGVIPLPQRVPWHSLQYTDRNGNKVDDELREKLQTVYLKMQPICVLADGLNVMDDVGGLYGYQEFLRTINSKDPDDADEKEQMKTWAKGMGWTGRKTKPENIL